MKRAVFAAVLMILIISFNIFCLNIIKKSKDDIIVKLDLLYETVNSADSKKAEEECAEFTEYWIEKHHTLCRVVRREPLEQITVAVSRFAPLAKYGEKGELSAEILRCKILITEIWDAERPLFRNIF